MSDDGPGARAGRLAPRDCRGAMSVAAVSSQGQSGLTVRSVESLAHRLRTAIAASASPAWFRLPVQQM